MPAERHLSSPAAARRDTSIDDWMQEIKSTKFDADMDPTEEPDPTVLYCA
jgi:hypothetical protein